MENKPKPVFTGREYLTHAHLHTQLERSPRGAFSAALLMYDNLSPQSELKEQPGREETRGAAAPVLAFKH